MLRKSSPRRAAGGPDEAGARNMEHVEEIECSDGYLALQRIIESLFGE